MDGRKFGFENKKDCNDDITLICFYYTYLSFHVSFANLLERYGDIRWRFSDTHGEMMALSTYAKYITSHEGKVHFSRRSLSLNIDISIGDVLPENTFKY